MNALERAKALLSLKVLFNKKQNSSGVAKAKLLKEIIDTRRLLGFSVKQDPEIVSQDQVNDQNANAVFQAVLDGDKTLSVETLQEVINEAVSNPDHYQLIEAAQKLLDEYNSSNGVLE